MMLWMAPPPAHKCRRWDDRLTSPVWHFSVVRGRPRHVRYRGQTGHSANSAEGSRMSQSARTSRAENVREFAALREKRETLRPPRNAGTLQGTRLILRDRWAPPFRLAGERLNVRRSAGAAPLRSELASMAWRKNARRAADRPARCSFSPMRRAPGRKANGLS